LIGGSKAWETAIAHAAAVIIKNINRNETRNGRWRGTVIARVSLGQGSRDEIARALIIDAVLHRYH
jgi:hypothetical protein